MEVDGKPYRSIWPSGDDGSFEVIDQTRLPHEFSLKEITSVEGAASAIRDMVVRGAPLIGATAAYGICLALRDDPSDKGLAAACEMLAGTRPSGVNLAWAIERMRSAVTPLPAPQRVAAALGLAARICDEVVETKEKEVMTV